ncbi:MAG: hypothetical protein IRZ08_18390, partial [Frankia sp.]|nr:hypothetical protein [Frankia sp.]
HPPDHLLWRPDGITRARCLRGSHGPPPDGSGEPTRHDAPAGLAVAASGDAHQGEAGERVPAEGCGCGLYAWRGPARLRAAPRPRWTSRPVVTGVVRLGGRVVVADRGYRAELAYPVAVLDPHGLVSPRYQIARYRSWPALLAEWDARPAAAS